MCARHESSTTTEAAPSEMTPQRPYSTEACSKRADEPSLSCNPRHSPADGSPLPVSPPTLLSLNPVNVTGEDEVPSATSDPYTSNPASSSNLTTVPAGAVIVTPVGISRPSSPSTTIGHFASGNVRFSVSVPVISNPS